MNLSKNCEKLQCYCHFCNLSSNLTNLLNGGRKSRSAPAPPGVTLNSGG